MGLFSLASILKSIGFGIGGIKWEEFGWRLSICCFTSSARPSLPKGKLTSCSPLHLARCPQELRYPRSFAPCTTPRNDSYLQLGPRRDLWHYLTMVTPAMQPLGRQTATLSGPIKEGIIHRRRRRTRVSPLRGVWFQGRVCCAGHFYVCVHSLSNVNRATVTCERNWRSLSWEECTCSTLSYLTVMIVFKCPSAHSQKATYITFAVILR